MFEEEKDDAISQLFLRSEHNLEKDLPSQGLWARIEKKLDQEATSPLKVEKIITTGNVSRWKPRYWLAAASVAACLLSAVAVWRMFDMSAQEKVLAQHENKTTISPTEPIVVANNNISAELPINQEEKEATYKIEDSVAAAKISNKTTYSTKTSETVPKKAEALALTTVSNLPTTVTITQHNVAKLETPSPTLMVSKTDVVKDVKDDINMGMSVDNIERIASVQSNRYISPMPTQVDKEEINIAEQKVNYKAESEKLDNINALAAKGTIRNRANAKSKEKSEGDTKNDVKASKKIVSSAPQMDQPMPTTSGKSAFDKINPRLSIFVWLVGKWSENRHDGTSYEEWQIKNRNTLIGKGYKIKGNDKLFEEHMTIFFDEQNQQTYLSLNVDDFKDPIVYTLARTVGDELVFMRDIQGEYPEKIIFQRTQEGYSIIFANEKTELSITQQTFLNQRNAVSNYRASRHLRRGTVSDK